MRYVIVFFTSLLVCQNLSAQELEMLSLKGNMLVKEVANVTDTLQTKVSIDVAIQNKKGLLIVHGLDDFGADTMFKFQGIQVLDQMTSGVVKSYAQEGYVMMNNYNINFNDNELADKAYISYDPHLNAYRVILTRGDTAYSIHSDDIYLSNWSRRRLHERAFDLSGFELYTKTEEGYKNTGRSDLEGRIVLGDENVTITLGENTENVPVWYKDRERNVFMYVGDAQEFRIDNVRKEVVYLTQLQGEVYQRMYVFRLGE